METDFNTMVTKVYQNLTHESKGEMLVLPTMVTEIETTRLHWKNVKEYLKAIQRPPDHFMEFLKKELGKEVNWLSGSKSDGLIVHGRFLKQVEIADISIKYVTMYVTCPSCKKMDTRMTKKSSKNYEFECLNCEMTKTVV